MAEASEYVLAPNEYVYISDQTKGDVCVHVGPCKVQVAGSEQPMRYENQTYERCDTVAEAVRKMPFADECSYVILKNPSEIIDTPHPRMGTKSSVPTLNFGRSINVQGPCTFAPWPGQEANVIKGHQLRSNQYLIASISNAEEAIKNWKSAVVSKVETAPSEQNDSNLEESSEENVSGKNQRIAQELLKGEARSPRLITGERLVIKGTDVSFYIPSTGIEIIQNETGKYVRDAVTLEHLRYCILLDENGNKRFVEGPAVVFPEPTESFVKRKNESGMEAFKYKALELNDQMGIHVKRIDNDKGEELFITGKDQKIYIPRPEHSIIKNGKENIHYAVIIPKGEARYVLNKEEGSISLKKGPCMFLPDPRKEQLIRRVIDPKRVALWFPGNNEALAYNNTLLKESSGYAPYNMDASLSKSMLRSSNSSTRAFYSNERESAEELSFGDELEQNTGQPNTLTLDTKYDGAVNIDIWSGYALQVISKSGDRKVVEGPKSVMLEYDELLEVISLSRGVPKSSVGKKQTVYLRVLNNRISDQVTAETADLVKVSITLSYRVNFEGDSRKWFDVEDYVGFLTDHLRSLIRNTVKQYGVEEFNDKVINLIRDTVLGESTEEGRTGRLFEENDMRVYDVEILDVKIGDAHIEQLLIQNQHEAVQETLTLKKKHREFESRTIEESLKQQLNKIQYETEEQKIELDKYNVENKATLNSLKLQKEFDSQKTLDAIHEAVQNRLKVEANQGIEEDQRRTEIVTKSFVDKFRAIQPDLIAALQAAGKMQLATEFCKSLPQSPAGLHNLFGGGGLEQLKKLVKGSVIEKGFNELMTPFDEDDK